MWFQCIMYNFNVTFGCDKFGNMCCDDFLLGSVFFFYLGLKKKILSLLITNKGLGIKVCIGCHAEMEGLYLWYFYL